jgi:hypothetical protein
VPRGPGVSPGAGLTLAFSPGTMGGPASLPDTVAGLGQFLTHLRQADPGSAWTCPVPGATLRLAA